MVAPTEHMAETKVKLTPMTMGSPLPMRHTGNSWMSVPMPAMSIADWMSIVASWMPDAAATMAIGAKLATNIAKTCWMPYGTPAIQGILASSVWRSADRVFFSATSSPPVCERQPRPYPGEAPRRWPETPAGSRARARTCRRAGSLSRWRCRCLRLRHLLARRSRASR